jgi:hypothetical protein
MEKVNDVAFQPISSVEVAFYYVTHGDLVSGKYISTLGFQNPSGDEFGSPGWGCFQLVFRFTSEP